IFSGTRGCGKTTTARILAKALNCLSPVNSNPDNTCEICEAITSGRSLDVIEIDGASNRGVEEIRNLRESVRYTPTQGKYKIYIIDEVHMLTKEAFNALLKTLEEPPAHVVFVFATTEVHKVPMTILSRCQRFDFRRIAIDEITTRLRYIAGEEKVTIDDEALVTIAKKGDGSMRDAQSIFDQVRSFCGSEIKGADVLSVLNAVDQEQFFRVSALIKARNVRGAIEFVDELMKRGHDLRDFVGGLAEHFRNILVVKSTGSTQLIETSEIYRKRYEAIAPEATEQDLLRLIKIAQDLEQSIRWVSQPRYKLEIALMQMVRMESSVRIEDLLAQLGELKKKLDGSVSVNVTPPVSSNVPLHSPEVSVAPPKSGSEVKVLGTVNAGTLRSATYVRSPHAYQPFDLARAASSPSTFAMRERSFEKPALQPVSSPAPQRPTMSGQELRTRWQEFIDGVTKAKIAIGTILTESTLIDCTQGTVQIGCPDDYHCSMLKRNKEFLSDTLQKVLGVRMNVEPTIHAGGPIASTAPQSATVTQPRPAASGENGSSREGGSGEHPLLTLMRKELGAEPVP
ncbi:MAG TPA: DNA polymerase III subunit gamma/tau, partial [Bacteroidota bacterium]|nr:DNA polymerase III subunit gamma/tau [Bacteroidota bacterium]